MVLALGQGQSPPFGGLHDVRLTVRRAAIGAMLTAEQLLEVADTLTCTGAMYRYRMRLDGRCRGLIDLLAPVEDLGPVAKTITGCIDARGHVLDMASPELAQVRQQLADVDERVQNTIKRLLRDPELRKILRYPNATVSGDHYVLPVAVNHRHKLQGVVHRTSSTGETRLHRAGRRRPPQRRAGGPQGRGGPRSPPHPAPAQRRGGPGRQAADDRHRGHGPTRPDHRQGPVQPRLRACRPRTSTPKAGSGCGRPGIRCWSISSANASRERQLPVKRIASPPGAHAPARQVVPIDVRLGIGFNLLVITGPNTGGKTVTLKTTGLLCLMAQSGMHIPAARGQHRARLPPHPGRHRRRTKSGTIADARSARTSRGSPTSCGQAGPDRLVLLDELGAGTDPTEGAALGRAILDELDRLGCRAMVTTHLGDLKTYAFSNERAENGAVEFDVETLRPTYRLHIGQFGMSNALQDRPPAEAAATAPGPGPPLPAAKAAQGPRTATPAATPGGSGKGPDRSARQQHEADQQREEFEQKAAELQREVAAAAALREARGRLQANDRVRVARFDQPGRVVRVDHGKGLAVVSVGLGQWEVPLDEVFPVNGS